MKEHLNRKKNIKIFNKIIIIPKGTNFEKKVNENNCILE